MLLGQDADEMLDAAVGNGINAFDTARNYGGAEASLGRWLKKRGVRGEVVLLSKCAHPDERGSRVNERAIREDFARSQEALGTDYIDIYLLHRDDERVPVGEIVELLNAMHREGKIGAFGGSNWTHERLAAANEYARSRGLIPFAASSPNFGLAHQMCDPWGGGCVTISGAENGAAREWYRKTQLPVIAYSSLGRGFFSGKFRSGERARARKVLDAVARKAYDCEENYQLSAPAPCGRACREEGLYRFRDRHALGLFRRAQYFCRRQRFEPRAHLGQYRRALPSHDGEGGGISRPSEGGS